MSAARARRAVTALTALAAAAAPLVFAPPAHADIVSPAPGAVVRTQPTVSGSQKTANNRTVDRVSVTLTPAAGGSPVTVIGCSGASCRGELGEFAAPFTVATNGNYTAVAVAEHDRRGPLDPADSGRSEPVTFAVEIAPAAPERLVAEANGGQRTVTLSWTPNTEADLLGYQVLRGVDGSTPAAHGDPVGPDTTTFVDEAGDGGQFAYQVVAIRRGATPSTIVASEASNTASATIDRAAPPTTAASSSTTTASDGSTGGASGGSSDGGAEATGGSPGALRPQASASAVRITPGARIDLSGFSPNTVPLNLGPAPAPDPGYQDTLPYTMPQPEDEASDATDEAGADEAALPVGSLTTTRTETNRRALLTFLAGAMLLFMLSMHLRWLLRRTTPVTG